MLFQLKEIILWPRNVDRPPRRIAFHVGKVNVITGASRTGKSAVTPIIDYCLAGGSCAIPVNTIRDACGWFGVVIKTEQGEKLFARREPGSQQITDDMFVMEAPQIEVPDRIPSKNANASQVRRMLDELAGLTRLDFSASDFSTSMQGRPSFRDLMAFVFQPQNVVANPDVFFFKADTHEHRQKLRTVFPYVLGAITPELMAKQHELQNLERELRRKERELTEARAVSARWIAEIRTQISNAKELGLLGPSVIIEDLSKEEMLELLKEVVARTDTTIRVTDSTISESLKELEHLEKEERSISKELTSRRRRAAEMQRLRESSSEYHQALRIQHDRLQLADWLVEQHIGNEECPVCKNSMAAGGKELEPLVKSLRELESAAGVSAQIPAAFDLEEQRIGQEISQFAEKIQAVQIRISALSKRSSEAEQKQYQAKKVERFIGNLENGLAFYERLGDDQGLAAEVAALRGRATILKREIDAADVKKRMDIALQEVNLNAGRLLPALDVEHPNSPVQLVIEDLTVKIINRGKADYLWQIGSGSNWLSYHIAMIFGLQQYFLRTDFSPVPHLVVIDQPSQVYFPKKLTIREGEVPDEPQLKDEDVVAVRKIFSVLDQAVESSKGALQVLVFDHASAEIWGNLPNTALVEEWRGGLKLVPEDWLSK